MSTPVSLYFTLQKSDDKGVDVLATVFNTFGPHPRHHELPVCDFRHPDHGRAHGETGF